MMSTYFKFVFDIGMYKVSFITLVFSSCVLCVEMD